LNRKCEDSGLKVLFEKFEAISESESQNSKNPIIGHTTSRDNNIKEGKRKER
jgi:hypothetical protein